MEITKGAAKLILATMLNEDLDPMEYSFAVGLDHKDKKMFITFVTGLTNVKNFYGLNVITNDELDGLIIDIADNGGHSGLIFKN